MVQWPKRWHQENEPPHDKTNKVTVCPAKTQISLGIRMKKAWVLSYPLSAQRRLWSDWVDAQADLSLCWVHSHFVCFVMSQLKCQAEGSTHARNDPTNIQYGYVPGDETVELISFTCSCGSPTIGPTLSSGICIETGTSTGCLSSWYTSLRSSWFCVSGSWYRSSSSITLDWFLSSSISSFPSSKPERSLFLFIAPISLSCLSLCCISLLCISLLCISLLCISLCCMSLCIIFTPLIGSGHLAGRSEMYM